MFTSVLVANRGEIACRVIRTLRTMGIRSIAIYTDQDFGARHIGLADTAVRVKGYLDIASVLDAAARTGAQAIHPGYGFLSENVEFARACAAARVVFVGPGVDAIEAMADKIRAKEHVSARGVPVIPGAGTSEMGDVDLIDAAKDVGFPLLIKPSAGGGGKGMTVVSDLAQLPDALVASRRVATKAFGDDTLLLERLVETPRHIEVQVLADTHGNTIHLGERECSLQRRNQKVIEEAPSPLLDEVTRAAIGEAACEVARSVGYVGAGTVEFLVSDAAPGEFFFMEMNTRLQVEHPVTELVTGLDLVEWQLRIAAGEPLAFGSRPALGHAVEARLYAEDAVTFLPATGRVDVLREPAGDGVRVDSALVLGLAVTSDYDPMLAKIIAWGSTRDEALDRLDRALGQTTVLGVRTNLSFLLALVRDDDVRAGRLDTGLIERRDFEPPAPDAAAHAAAALIEHDHNWSNDLWSRPSGWRVGSHRPVRYNGVAVAGSPRDATVDGIPTRFSLTSDTVTVEFDGEARTYSYLRADDETWLSRDGVAVVIPRPSRQQRLAAHRATLGRVEGAANPEVRSAMPGTVVSVVAGTGTVVEVGTPLLTIEAMKMEHTMLASVAGVVSITVSEGDQVRLDQVVARIDPHEGAS